MKTKKLKITLSNDEHEMLVSELIDANNAEQFDLDNTAYDKAERKAIERDCKMRHKLVGKLIDAWHTTIDDIDD